MTTDDHSQHAFLELSDPMRCLLLQRLCEECSGTAAGFATCLPITRQAIIMHLVTLEPKEHGTRCHEPGGC